MSSKRSSQTLQGIASPHSDDEREEPAEHDPAPAPGDPAKVESALSLRPLDASEGHDAWTVNRLDRSSSPPPAMDAIEDETPRDRASGSAVDRALPDDCEGGALDLVDKARPSQQLNLLGEMEDFYALGDFTSALQVAELVVGRESDNEQASRCAANCRRQLILMHSSKLGSLQHVPHVTLNDTESRWLGLDSRAGFILSRIDGVASVEDLLDVCGMPRIEALKTLVELLELGAIHVKAAR